MVRLCRRVCELAVAVLLAMALSGASAEEAGARVVKIGVIALRDPLSRLVRMEPTANYLTAKLPGYSFQVVPLRYPELPAAIRDAQVDFVVAATAIYAEIQASQGVSAIATLKRTYTPKIVSPLIGGVVVTRASEARIRSFHDLRGKHVLSYDHTAIGGWHSIRRELRDAGIDPYRDFSRLEFARSCEDAVLAVGEGLADAAVVPTGILEGMTDRGLIEQGQFRSLPAPRELTDHPGFRLLRSTRLYPQTPFAKLRGTPESLAQKVATALFEMPADHPAAVAAGSAGWTVPLNYQTVHECFRDLRFGPYKDYGKVTLEEAVRQHLRPVLAILLGALVGLGLITFQVSRLNARLRSTRKDLELELAERRRAEEALRESEAQLAQAQKLEGIGRLAGGVAHDLNNNLTVINGYCDLILSRLPASDPNKDKLCEVRKAGERAATLTRQLLAFSRKQVLNLQPLSLNEAVKNLDGMLRRLVREEIQLVTSLSPDLGTVMADPGQMEQVLVNLVLNAKDAIQGPGRVTIETANVNVDGAYAAGQGDVQLGGYVLVSVTDTGAGMDEDTRAHIFEPFFTTKEGGRGTGLGLSTVYGIVKQSGGWLRVFSEPGKGSAFEVYLPRVEAPAAKAPMDQTVRGAGGAGETVLLVEDQAEVRALAAEVLAAAGYRILEAGCGNEALAMSPPVLQQVRMLVTDVVMPEMSGRELAEKLRAVRPDLRVLYISGYTPNEIAHRGVLDPGVEYLPKPFTPAQLTEKVQAVLERPA